MNYLKYLVEEIQTTVMATTDANDLPVTCAIDVMDYDDNGLYFLTAKGKDTMSCVAVSLRGKVKEIGSEPLERLFKKNSYMYEIYPTEQSRKALTVFCIYDANGEWFDLSKKPIERADFSIGNSKIINPQ